MFFVSVFFHFASQEPSGMAGGGTGKRGRTDDDEGVKFAEIIRKPIATAKVHKHVLINLTMNDNTYN